MRDTCIQRLMELAAADTRIMLLTADLGFRVLDEFKKNLPDQFLNVGVAEQNMVGIASGMALEGRIVFIYSIANFPTLRCLEQLRNDACYHEAPVKVISVGAGLSYGQLGMSHHGTEDVAILRAIPNLTVFSPGDKWEVARCTEALVACPGTGYIRIDYCSARETHKEGEVFTPGKLRMVRDGSDLSIIALGGSLEDSLIAAETLQEKGISCRVLSCHTIKPFDPTMALKAAKETGGIVTVEDHTINGGLGALIAENLLEAGVHPGYFRRIGMRDIFSTVVGSQRYLKQFYKLDGKAIADTIYESLAKKKAANSGSL